MDRCDARTTRPGRVDTHNAAFARILSDAGEDDQAQADRNADCGGTRTKIHEETNLRVLRELGGPGSERIVLDQRLRGGVEGIFQQRSEGHHAARSDAAGRIDSASELSVAVP